MARVTKTNPRRRRGGPSLRGQANQQAAAEYQPQVRGVRRETRGQVRSLRTQEDALQDTLSIARRELRHAGLEGDDLRMGLRELAYRSADVGAGTALQVNTLRQDAQGQVQDLLASQGQAQSSILGELQGARQERQQELADAQRERTQGLQDAIRLEQAFKKLGLGQYYAEKGSGGLTPTQRRDAEQSSEAARYYAKEAFDALRESGKVPEDPREWDESIWDALTGGVHKQKGVDNVEDASQATSAIRDHFGGDENILGALGTLAKGTILPLATATAGPPVLGTLLGEAARMQRQRRR